MKRQPRDPYRDNLVNRRWVSQLPTYQTKSTETSSESHCTHTRIRTNTNSLTRSLPHCYRIYLFHTRYYIRYHVTLQGGQA